MDLKYYKRFCKEPEKIENYEKALEDKFIGWQCHHRLETHTSDGERRLVDITADELQALGMYWNRPASELIFLKISEHRSLHTKGESNPMYGKHFSEEHKNKISEAKKGKCTGENNAMYGKHHSFLSIQKMSDAKKGKHASKETKKKMSLQKTGRHWYNNGKENKFCYECPDGFTPGKLR